MPERPSATGQPKAHHNMKNPNIPNHPNTPKSGGRPGYEYLAAYKLGKVIQDLTAEFCHRFLKDPKDPNYPNYKLIEQMNGAASTFGFMLFLERFH